MKATHWTACCALLAGAAAAQVAADPRPADWVDLPGGARWRIAAIEGAARCWAVLWPHPFAADAGAEKALAHAVAAFRCARARAALPPGVQVGAEVLDGATLYHATAPRTAAGAAPDLGRRWLLSLTAAADPVGDRDALELDAARCALSADDALWLYPGEVLQGRARLRLAAGTAGGAPLRGSPVFLQQCTVPALAAAVGARPGGALRAVQVGDPAGAAEFVEALAAVAAPPGGGGERTSPAPEPAFTRHPRVDGPFVAAAVAAPRPGPDELPWAIGVEVLRARALRRFAGYRGQEAAARAPFVAYAFLAGDPVLVLCRRGPDRARMPTPGGSRRAAAAASVAGVERPRGELEALLLDARERAPAAAEVALAVSMLGAEWAVPPWSPERQASLRESPEGLLPRARALLLLDHWGVPDAAVRALPEAAPTDRVHAALRERLDPQRVYWAALEPVPWPDSQRR